MAYLIGSASTTRFSSTYAINSGASGTGLHLVGNPADTAAVATGAAATLSLYISSWGTQTNIRACLYDESNSGALLASVVIPSSVGTGLIEVALAGSVTITSGNNYRLGLYTEDGDDITLFSDQSGLTLRRFSASGSYTTPADPSDQSGGYDSNNEFYWAIQDGPAGLTIDSTDATMAKQSTFGMTVSNPPVTPTASNTSLTLGAIQIPLSQATNTSGDIWDLEFPIGDIPRQADPTTGYDWTLDVGTAVVANTAPVVSLVGNASIPLTVGDTYTEQGATVVDSEDGVLTIGDPIFSPSLDLTTAGTYVATYSVTDSGGLVGTATRDVVVSASGGGSGFTLPTMTEGSGDTYYLRQGGNDSNDGLDTFSGFATFNYAQAQMSAGDTLLIEQGTWTEASGAGYMSVSGQGDITEASWAVTVSGTDGEPITFKADPANTQPVILDGEHVFGGNASFKAGIFINYNKYLNFSGIQIQNCMGRGIYNYDHPGEVVVEANVASDIWIEKCPISHVGGSDNDCGIGIWSGRRITMINNDIEDIYGWPANSRLGAGILSYGLVESVIRNNTITGDNGIFLKDHYVVDAGTREATVECEIAYNKVIGEGRPINVSVQPQTEAGANYIHHNIAVTTDTAGGARGISIDMAGVDEPTTAKQRIEHNLVIGPSSSDSAGIYLTGVEDVELSGNLVFGFTRCIEAVYVTFPNDPVIITASDYNVFSYLNELAILGRYSTETTATYADLTAWQAATAASTAMLSVDNPDTNGITATLAATITDAANEDYSYAGSSPALGLMADSSNAGPYQHDNETIGVVA